MTEKKQKAEKVERAAKPEKAQKAEKGQAKKVEPAAEVQFTVPAVPPRLKERYQAEVVPDLMARFGYRNKMQAPRLVKIVVNCGVGEAIQDSKALEGAMNDIAAITGQKPAMRRAKKSIAAFKLRAKMPVGCTVTLRGQRMWEFFDRLANVALPRIRDFRGLPVRSVDGRGNYSIGLREQLVFPEIDLDKVERVHGMDITIVTTAKSDEEALALLTELGLPIRRGA
jgi:large subunit ribosomal protein L5